MACWQACSPYQADGAIDYVPIFSALADIGYDDWVIIEAEQDPAKADPRKYAELGLAHIRSCVEKAYPSRKVENTNV